MAFGVRLPGIRISTRGVRIGPRFANVRVGRGGVRASVGPSFARVSAGTGGVRVGSRIGPVGVSNRGVRISGGLGPVRASVGTGRSRGSASAGPVWLSTGGRKRRSRSTGGHAHSSARSQIRSIYGDSRARPSAGNSFAEYKSNLRAAGIQRRNQYELFDAGMQAWLMDLAPLVSLARPYPEAKMPTVPPLPAEHDVKRAATAELQEVGSLSLWPPTRNQMISERAESIRDDLVFERAVLERLANEAYARFKNMDTAMNLIVLQSAFADNAGTAAPIDLDDDHLLILMSYPSVNDAVWPEKGIVTTEQFKVGKRTKTEMVERYQRNLMCHTAATAKEAFCAQPNLETVSLVVVAEQLRTQLSDLPVLLGAKFDRGPTLKAATVTNSSWVETWDECLAVWDAGSGEWGDLARSGMAAVMGFLHHEKQILGLVNRTLNDLDDTWMFAVSKKEGFAANGVLKDLLPAEQLEAASKAGNDKAFASPIATPAHNPVALHDCLFWCEALEMAQAWKESLPDGRGPIVEGAHQAPDPSDRFWDAFVERLTRT